MITTKRADDLRRELRHIEHELLRSRDRRRPEGDPWSDTADRLAVLRAKGIELELEREVVNGPQPRGMLALAATAVVGAYLLGPGALIAPALLGAGLLALSARGRSKPSSARAWVDPAVTPDSAYRLAALNPKYTGAVLRHFFGAGYVESLEGEPEEPVGTEPAPIPFRKGARPGLLEQEVHEIAARTFAMRVTNMSAAWPALPFHILHGYGGTGKTTLVKVVAQEIRDRLAELGLPAGHFVEAFGGDLRKPKKLDAKIRLANSRPGSLLFIDEIHAIPPELAERMYMMLDRDFRYTFDGDAFPTALQPFTVIGATTDLGKLHPAFRSRAELVPLSPVPIEQLGAIALGMPFEVEPEAADLVVSRLQWDGSPRLVVNLIEFAREFAKEAGRDGVTLADAAQAIEVRQLDEWGLGPFHRAVVGALARSPTTQRGRGKDASDRIVYRLAESNLLAMAKIDAHSYREELRPALIDRGFLGIGSGGQQLTDAGVAYARGKGLLR